MRSSIYPYLLVFIAGNLFIQNQAQFPNALWLWAGGAGLALCFSKYRIGTGFFIGIFWSYWVSYALLEQQLESNLQGQDLVVLGIVDGLPQTFEKGTRFNFNIQSGRNPKQLKLPKLVRLSWYFPTQPIKAGQEWQLTVRLKQPNGTFNPGGFDYERWLFLNRIGATGYVRQPQSARLIRDNQDRLSIENTRQQLDANLSLILGESAMIGLVKALTIGARNDITPSQWQILRSTGTAHLIAISGLHIGLVAGLSYLLFRWLWCFTPIQRLSPNQLAAITAIILAASYAALAGFSIPTQRALIMVSVAMAAIFFQRHTGPLRVLIIALFLVTVFDPIAVLSPGFWLSFTAVTMIIYAFTGKLSGFGYWSGAVKVQWVSVIALTPLLLFFFHKTSLIAPIANLIAVPLISIVVVPLLLIGISLLTIMPAIGGEVIQFTALLLEVFWAFLTWISAFSFSEWTATPPSIVALVLAIFAVLLIIGPKGLPCRWLAAVLVLPLIIANQQQPNERDVWIDLLDVGQGLSVVVQTHSKTMVYDTGARFSDQFDMGRSVVAPFLRSHGISRIDTLVISHGDNDHIGGARSLSTEFPPGKIFASDSKQIDWQSSIRCKAGESWLWDSVEFMFLSPIAEQQLDENNMSCVLQISAKGGKILLPGDIERISERILVENYGRTLKSDVLVVPHHGSNTSSSRLFIEAVKPKFALISAGYQNRFGFPKAEIVTRLAKLNSQVLNTAELGAIHIEIDDHSGVTKPKSYRLLEGHYWNRR